jgi:ABC-type transport system substrate-binding protein
MYFLQNFISFFSSETRQIGVSGLYTGNRLPPEVISHITTPLLQRKPNGTYESKLLDAWEHDAQYTTFTLHLKKNLTYTDGTSFTSSSIPFQFREVKVDTSDPYVIRYTLAKPFPNFLEYLTKPIYTDEPIRGIGGDYLISSIKLTQNQDQIDQINLVPLTSANSNITYRIYRSESDLITAFKLHEIDEFTTSNESAYLNFKNWPRTTATKSSTYEQIVTLFIDTTHPILKERTFREALYGSLPVAELEKLGNIAVSPISPFSPYYDKQLARTQDKKVKDQSQKLIKSAANKFVTTKLYKSLTLKL